MESKLPLVALFTVAVAACNWSDHREGAVFSHVTGDIVSFPTARLEASVARIQPPGQPSVGIVTPIPPDALFTQGLVPEAMIGKLKTLPDTEGWKVTPDNFVASPVFTDFLQRFLAERVPGVAEYQAEAKAIGDGWLYVIDRRGPAKMLAPPVRDVIGAFAVRAGVMQSRSYRRNDAYMLLTEDGLSVLHRDLTDALTKALVSINARQKPQP